MVISGQVRASAFASPGKPEPEPEPERGLKPNPIPTPNPNLLEGRRRLGLNLTCRPNPHLQLAVEQGLRSGGLRRAPLDVHVARHELEAESAYGRYAEITSPQGSSPP